MIDSGNRALHLVQPDDGVLGSLRILAGIRRPARCTSAFESETAPSPGSALDVHAHARYDESEYVLTGEREIAVENQRWHAAPGFFALAPRHARHGMRTVGSAPSRWLHFFSPAGIERYFMERERLREAGADAAELRALSQRHGVGAVIQSEDTENVYISSPATRRDGIIVSGRTTRNAYALAEPAMLPEEEHAHPDQEEAFYVISGELTLEVEGASVTAPARSFVLVPRGLRRRHVTTIGTRVLAIFSPGRAVPHATHAPVRPS